MAREIEAASRFLYDLLSASSGLAALVSTRIYLLDDAPQGTGYPLVLASFLSSEDVNVVGHDQRIMSPSMWSVQAIDDGSSFQVVENVDAEIDAAIMGQSGSTTNPTGFVMGCFRVSAIRMSEVDEQNRRFVHMGGIYKVYPTTIP